MRYGTNNRYGHPTSSYVRAGDRNSLAPIALFAYNRIEHMKRTVEALRVNDLAPRSDLFVFCDGAKNEAGRAAVEQVRNYACAIQGFRSVTVIEREENWGLANSVIRGITESCNKFGRVIAMEDDLLTTSDFLTFMNQALERYECEKKIFSVSGFNFGLECPQDYRDDAFCFYRSSSLGWGTWRDRWERADWTMADFSSFCANQEQQRLFNRGGEDLCRMLAMQMQGKSDSWAVRWAYTHFRQNALALLSLRPRIFHIGSDRHATHSRWNSFKQLPLTEERKTEFRFPDVTRLEESFVLELQKSFRPSLAKKVARFLLGRRIRMVPNGVDASKLATVKLEHSGMPEPNRRSLVD